MKAEIISVGTELLLGQIVNTDAQYLSKQLSYLGIDVFRQLTVGDNAGRLKEAIGESLERCDMLILTGGLGPTADDLTKETAAEYFSLEMEEHKESMERLKGFFKGREKAMTPNNLKQAYFPKGCKVLKNEKGTAPGCIINEKGKIVVILPGPPFELIDMFEKQVLPYLKENCSAGIHSRILRLFGIGESQLEFQIKDLMESSNPTVAPYAGFGEVTLRLTVKCPNDADPNKYLDPMETEIRRRVGDFIYGYGNEKLETVAAKMLVEKGVTISTAESLTGGMVASTLIDYPGISSVMLSSVVAYSNEAKINILGVKEETLRAHGAVSREVAAQMAEGMRKLSGSDVAVSTTGIAGPGGATDKKPVGLVYIGFADKNGTRAYELNLRGDRERVRRMTMLNAMDIIRTHI
ncbi:MAG: competence/damage-inducible protein A [Clostridiales bacterium]|nr:competence/damage-inducible protein A [Clostridiales bacterium]